MRSAETHRDAAGPARRPAAVAAVAAGALAVLAAALETGLRAAEGLAPTAIAAAALAFALTGSLLAWLRPRGLVGWLLLGTGLSMGLSSGFLAWAERGLVADPGSLPGTQAALWLGSWLWVPGYCLVATLLPLRLPDGRLRSSRWRVAWWAAVAASLLATLGWATTPYDRMDRPPLPGLPDGVVSPAGLAVGPALLAASLPLVMLGALVGLVCVVLRLRASAGEERQQLKWVAYGAVLSILLLALGQVAGPEGGSDLLLGLGILPLPVGVAIAALRYRLWDVDLVIRRTIAYVVLTALVVGVYAVTVLTLGSTLGERTGAPLLATVVVALTAEPARRRVQRIVDKVTRGDRSDPYRALVALGNRLEAAATAPVSAEALARVADAVRDALRLPWVVVDVLDGPTASSGETPRPGEPGTEVPLVHGGDLVGRLVVGSLPPADLALLEDLARPVAVAAHAAQLRDALQQSRERLVLAREEERRRLRHDLHDDLGPLLAAVALHVGEIRTQVGDHPAAGLAERAETLLTGAVATVRRIVDGLRPAALDDLGLSEALQAAADGFAVSGLDVDVEVRGELRDLPAAVEVATLRIATEALSNAARHAGATRVRLAVERLPHHLEVTVADDGRGLTAGRRTGVGLVSMRERAEELGGSCTVTTGPGGGTVVVATLPAAGAADERVRA